MMHADDLNIYTDRRKGKVSGPFLNEIEGKIGVFMSQKFRETAYFCDILHISQGNME